MSFHISSRRKHTVYNEYPFAPERTPVNNLTPEAAKALDDAMTTIVVYDTGEYTMPEEEAPSFFRRHGKTLAVVAGCMTLTVAKTWVNSKSNEAQDEE